MLYCEEEGVPSYQRNVFMTLERRRNGYHVYGFPGGQVEHGESHFGAMCRELKEETGLYFSDDWKYMYTIVSQDCVTYVYTTSQPPISPQPDNKEIIEVCEMSIMEVSKGVDNNAYNMRGNYRMRQCARDQLSEVRMFIGL